MTERILKILDNVRYWDTCPEDYKKDIETFLKSHNEALRIHDVVGRSEQLACVHPYVDVYQSETECYCEKCGKDLTEAS